MSLWDNEYQMFIKDLAVSKHYKPQQFSELFVAKCYNKIRTMHYNTYFHDKDSFLYIIDQRPEYLHYDATKFPSINDMLDNKTSWTTVYKYNYKMIAMEHQELHEELMKS